MEVFIGLLGGILLLWYIWRRQHLSQFKRLGIPGPEPSILFGNILELYSKGPIKCHEEWVQEYGRVLGYFYGMKPVLLITDPQMLKNIFIRDFAKFINREAFNPIYHYDPNNKHGQSVLILPGKKWKEVRSVLTPTFTTAKMKQMSGSMNSSVDTLLKVMRERADSGQFFDAFDTYQRVTMDVITRTAFGVRTDIQTNMKSKLLKATALLFRTEYRDPIIFVGLCFPYLEWLCRKVQSLLLFLLNRGKKPDVMLHENLKKVLQHRRENAQVNQVDFLQIMIDAKIYTDNTDLDMKRLEAGNADLEATYSKEGDSSKSFKTLEDHEIISSSTVVLLAGYETTSTALAFTTYLLAKHPDIQEKLFEEINEVVQDGQKLDYATINKLSFLDKVLNESIRIYPPVYLFTNRYAIENVQYGDLQIPEGTLIQAPVYFLHHDPELWTNPETFDPERFNTKPNANGITYLPFGVGPRNCLGMRFAQLEAKLVLAHVFYNFKVYVDDGQKENLETLLRIRTVAPKNGIKIRLEPRDNMNTS